LRPGNQDADQIEMICSPGHSRQQTSDKEKHALHKKNTYSALKTLIWLASRGYTGQSPCI